MGAGGGLWATTVQSSVCCIRLACVVEVIVVAACPGAAIRSRGRVLCAGEPEEGPDLAERIGLVWRSFSRLVVPAVPAAIILLV